MTSWDRELSGMMIKYLAEFARRGNPNGPDLPVWHSVYEKEGNCMVFGDGMAEEHLSGML